MTTPESNPNIPASRIVFFDGVCVLCENSVRLLLRIDRRGVLHYASLQGDTARCLLPTANREALSTLLYWENGELSDRSTAVLRILRDLGGVWRVVSWLRIIPAPLRDAVYRFIAARRYRWFGKKEEACFLPAPEQRDRMLD